MIDSTLENRVLSELPFYEELSADVSTAVAPMLHRNNMGIFEFARVYDNGKCVLLSSNPSLIRFLYTSKTHITAHIPKEVVSKKFWYFLPQKDLRYKSIHTFFSERYHSNSVVDFIERHPGYYDQFAFGHAETPDVSSNYFLNNRDILEKFCFEVRDKLAGKIQKASKTPLTLLDAMLPNIHGLAANETLQEQFLGLNLQQGEVDIGSLTRRERDCLDYLVLGCTAKETANALGLSYRTVEFYLDNLRSKLGYDSKAELAQSLRAKAGYFKLR